LDIGYFFGFDSERPSEELVAKGNRFVVPIDPAPPRVESVVPTHEEKGEVAPGAPHVIYIFQADAGLADHEWVCGWRDLATRHPWLEVGNGSYGEEDVITPAGNHRITLEDLVAPPLEKIEKRLLHFHE
jgi:hypothetical protein